MVVAGPLRRPFPAVASLLLLVFGLLVSFRLAFLEHVSETRSLRDHISIELDKARSALTAELYSALYLSEGMVALVEAEKDVDQARFEAMAKALVRRHRTIRHLALAPGNIIRFIYPLRGNEAALGLDYTQIPEQRAAVERAIAERRMVVAGPVEMVQGGIGVIGRSPIFVRSPEGGESYWGIAATVVELDKLLALAGFQSAGRELQIAIRGRDGTGAAGAVFWGDPGVFTLDPVVTDVALPSGGWQLGAVPPHGWPRFHPLTSPTFLAGVGVSIVSSLLLLQVLLGSLALRRMRSELEVRVEERTAELSQANVALVEENEMHLRAEAEIRRLNADLRTHAAELATANQRLQELDRLKSEFLATMSHELRTPLNSILGFTGIVLQRMAGPLTEEQARQLAMVHSSATHLLTLINDLLDLSRIEAGRIELDHRAYDLHAVVSEVEASCRPAVAAKGLAFRVDLPPGPLTLAGDRKRCYQVLLNLASNAVKFTEKGEVRVSAAVEGEQVRVTVADTGIGIRKEHLGMLFEAFRQVDGSARRVYEGTGLGLYLCRKLLGLMGGEIGVESVHGEGSRFRFTLPLHGPPESAGEVRA